MELTFSSFQNVLHSRVKDTRFALAKGLPYQRPPKMLFQLFLCIFSANWKLSRQYIHLFPGTFYHLHFHIKFAALNHRVNVFTLLVHFHLATSTVFSIHLHTVIGLIRGKFLLQFFKKETPAQQQQGYRSLWYKFKEMNVQKC